MSRIVTADVAAAVQAVVTACVRDDYRTAAELIDADEGVWADLLHGTLALMRAAALRLRSPLGLMAIHARLSEEASLNSTRGLAAQLILGWSQAAEPIDDAITAAETYPWLQEIGAATFNEAVLAACEQGVGDEVLLVAIGLWMKLLPELDTAGRHTVAFLDTVAAELWPAPPAL